MQYGFFIVLLASIATVLLKGGQPEKCGGGALIVMALIQFIGRGIFGVRYAQIDWVAFTVDLVGFASFTAIALFARRIWPLWASTLQLFCLTTHFFRVLDIHLQPAVYWLVKSVPTFAICLSLIVATVLHWLRVVSNGGDASWTVWRDRPGRPRSTRMNPRY